MPPAQQEQLGAGGSLLLAQPHPTAPNFGMSPAQGQDNATEAASAGLTAPISAPHVGCREDIFNCPWFTLSSLSCYHRLGEDL